MARQAPIPCGIHGGLRRTQLHQPRKETPPIHGRPNIPDPIRFLPETLSCSVSPTQVLWAQYAVMGRPALPKPLVNHLAFARHVQEATNGDDCLQVGSLNKRKQGATRTDP